MVISLHITETFILVTTLVVTVYLLRDALKESKTAFSAKITDMNVLAKRLIFKRRAIFNPQLETVPANDHLDWLDEALALKAMRD